ncbi:MAG: hypothetical protein ACK5LK_05360 [Chthoniobacterales bacterium]
MRFLSCALILSAVAATQSWAGGFGGPAPFQNGSPLTSGIDGVYQASVSGSNSSGVISFTISSGYQGTSAMENWVIFRNGAVYRGPVAVNFVDERITGVLDTDGTAITAPDVAGTKIITSDYATGDFSAQIDLKDPMGKFDGEGDLYPMGNLNSAQVLTVTVDPVTGELTYDMVPVNIEGSGQYFEFNVQGVRHSTTPPAS